MLKLPRNGALCRATRTSLLTALLLLGQVLLASAAANEPQEGPRLPPFTASYEAQAMGNTLNARITLNHEDVQTRMAMDAHVSGFLRILGRFELSREALMNANDVGLQLVTSRSREVTPRRERKVETRFDWEEDRAIGHVDNERFDIEVPPHTLDFLGSLYFMMQRLEAGDLAGEGDGETVQTLERDRLREYRFEYADTETIESPMGRIETVRVVRKSRDSDIELSAWFAPDLSHLPVRFDYEADGRVFELKLTRLEWHDPIIDLTE
ncbi:MULTISPECIES: DUF3108 domain-containing protein [unclassified Thioalkalivibrio]|uniref:DUF3108 domain-containing protein n=1 Tax=unclassified Thioalkalivibrio TaxID=2621013 RepID=UPI0003620660|nr:MULTISPECIES: DUF3108 domain-containing protein [unclassified Thioalkalivibrio]